MDRIRVGIIGCGDWGKRLIRNFAACPLTNVAAVCDPCLDRLQESRERCPIAVICASLRQLLGLGLDAVAIATPVSTHFAVAQRCLNAGLHVLVEKPLAGSALEAATLIDLAAERSRVLMVDHTYLFHEAIWRIKELIGEGELGELKFVDGIRANWGKFHSDVNVVWDLLPHDLAIMDFILGRSPSSIAARGRGQRSARVEQAARLIVDYDDGVLATLHVSWLSPTKIRRMIFAGSSKTLVFDESNGAEPLVLYPPCANGHANRANGDWLRDSFDSAEGQSRLHPSGKEALQTMVTHFATCIRDSIPSVSDGQLGLRIVRLLEMADKSMQVGGRRIAAGDEAPCAAAAGAHAAQSA